jgi:hypothetical protein
VSPTKSKALIFRRIARVWSLLSIAFVLMTFIGELFDPSGPAPTSVEWVGLAFFPIGVVIGLILAWRWEGIGGATAVLSLLAFYIWDLIRSGDLPGGPFFFLVAAPGFLFLANWYSSRDHLRMNHA